MKNTIMFISLVSALFYISCSGNDTPESDPTIIPTTSISPAAVIKPADTTAPVLMNTPIENQQAITKSQTLPASKSLNSKSGAGLNPEHGQPGHRCDIAVGAPLNSAPAATATNTKPVVQTQATPVVTPVAAPSPVALPSPVKNGNQNSSTKLNPPHGEPGHDCSIQVGAPLKN